MFLTLNDGVLAAGCQFVFFVKGLHLSSLYEP